MGAHRGFIIGDVAGGHEMSSSLGHYDCGIRFGEVDLRPPKEAQCKVDNPTLLGRHCKDGLITSFSCGLGLDPIF